MAHNSAVRMGVTALLALATILWLPYALADWTLFDTLGTELGVMVATLLFIAGVYDLAESANVVDYPGA